MPWRWNERASSSFLNRLLLPQARQHTDGRFPRDQVELYATKGDEYKFQFMAKGGGSANKTFLFQQTKAVLNPDKLMAFLEEKIKTLGTSACPPYHLAIAVGGLSAEMTLKVCVCVFVCVCV